MNIKQIKNEARNILREKYHEAFVVVFACFVISLSFKMLELIVCTFFIYSGNLTVQEMFYENSKVFFIFRLIFQLFQFSAMVPVLTGAVWWFSQAVSSRAYCADSVIQLYTSFKVNIRAALLYAVIWVIQTVSLIPSCGLIYGAYIIVRNNGNYTGMLFIAVQMIVLALVLLGVYVMISLGMVLAPFIFVRYPMDNPIKIIRYSQKLMKGNKLRLTGLLLSYVLYLPLMAAIVTIPFILPKMLMSLSVFAESTAGDEIMQRLRIKKVHSGRNAVGEVKVHG